MSFLRFCKGETGTAAVEFGLTAPGYFALFAGIMCCGLLLWTQLALQHGTERAARCASVNSTVCGSVAAIQSYAAQQALGLNPPSSTFSVTTASCGSRVTAIYTFALLTSYFGLPTLTLGAESCFPK